MLKHIHSQTSVNKSVRRELARFIARSHHDYVWDRGGLMGPPRTHVFVTTADVEQNKRQNDVETPKWSNGVRELTH